MTGHADRAAANRGSRPNVLLYRKNTPVARCVLRYLGMLGMVIDPGPLSYARNTQLEVELVRNTLDGLKRFRLPVIVSKSSARGLMLMYKGSDAYDCGDLKDMILQLGKNAATA